MFDFTYGCKLSTCGLMRLMLAFFISFLAKKIKICYIQCLSQIIFSAGLSSRRPVVFPLADLNLEAQKSVFTESLSAKEKHPAALLTASADPGFV